METYWMEASVFQRNRTVSMRGFEAALASRAEHWRHDKNKWKGISWSS